MTASVDAIFSAAVAVAVNRLLGGCVAGPNPFHVVLAHSGHNPGCRSAAG